jgi:hypothetical protein
MVSKANIEESVPDFVAARDHVHDELWNIRFVRTLRWAGVNVPANAGTNTSAHASRSGHVSSPNSPTNRRSTTCSPSSGDDSLPVSMRADPQSYPRTGRAVDSHRSEPRRPTSRLPVGWLPHCRISMGNSHSAVHRTLAKSPVNSADRDSTARIGYKHNARREKA